MNKYLIPFILLNMVLTVKNKTEIIPENKPITLDMMTPMDDINRLDKNLSPFCQALKNFNEDLKKKVYTSNTVPLTGNARHLDTKYMSIDNSVGQISDQEFKVSFNKLLESIESELVMYEEIFAQILAQFITREHNCLTKTELDELIFNFLYKKLVNSESFLKQFILALDNSMQLNFIKDNIKRFFKANNSFMNIVDQQYHNDPTAVINQFCILYSQVLYLKDARDNDYLKHNIESAANNVLKTGGIYALLYASTLDEFGPNDYSSYFYKALYNTGLLCLAHSINSVYSYNNTQQHIDDVFTFNINNNKCIVQIRGLDKLAELIKRQASKEIELKNQQTVKKKEVFNVLDDLSVSNRDQQDNILDSFKLDKNRLGKTTSNIGALYEEEKVISTKNVNEKHKKSQVTKNLNNMNLSPGINLI